MASRVCAPGTAFQVHWKGDCVAVPPATPSTRNWTRVTSESGAVATSTPTLGPGSVLPLTGARMVKAVRGSTGGGPAGPTVICTGALRALLLAGLLATTVRVWSPAVAVQTPT